MKNNKELNEQNLDSISGGKSDLDKYLKTLVNNNKNKILVDQGTGKQLDLDPSIQIEDDSKLIIIKREKDIDEE